MKRWMAALACILMIIPMTVTSMSASAEETKDKQTTSGQSTSETTGSKPGSSTDSSVTGSKPGSSATKPTDSTAPAEPVKVSTHMSISYERRTITVRVTDENGKPVASAPVAIAVDGNPHSVKTNSSGVATLTVTADPQVVRASMASFQTASHIYEGSQASVTLGTSPTGSTAGSSATASQSATTPRTTPPTASKSTSASTSRITASTPDNEGEITEVVTMTGSGANGATTDASHEETGRIHQKGMPRGMALWLMLGGGALVLAAIALLCVFLFHRPHDPEEDEDDVDGADVEVDEQEQSDTDDNDDDTDGDGGNDAAVSLQDLFLK